MPRDDAELVARASQGDQSAFATLYSMYQTELYRFVLYLTDGPDEAEELFQETWFRVVSRLGKTSVIDFKKWLFAIAANAYRDELRKRRVRRIFLGRKYIEEERRHTEVTSRPVGSPEMPTVAEDFAIREALVDAMKKLTHRQRTVFTLAYIEGFKIHEVSDILGKSEGTIKSTLHRALVILREALKEFRH